MSGLLAAEFLKLRTLRSSWGFALVTLLLAGLVTAGDIGGATVVERLDPELQFRIALDAAFPAAILSLLFALILVTNEFRHGTIARTLLATPRRGRFVLVKLLTGASVGAVLIMAALLVAFVTSAIWLPALDVAIDVDEWSEGVWRAAVATVLAGVLGAAIGGAVHSQIAAIVGVLVWIFVLEPICWVLLELLDVGGVADYLPAAALGGMIDSEADGSSWLRAAAVTAGWAAIAAVLAHARTSRKDIT